MQQVNFKLIWLALIAAHRPPRSDPSHSLQTKKPLISDQRLFLNFVFSWSSVLPNPSSEISNDRDHRRCNRRDHRRRRRRNHRVRQRRHCVHLHVVPLALLRSQSLGDLEVPHREIC